MRIYTRAEHSRPHLSWVSFYHATTPSSIIDYREDTEWQSVLKLELFVSFLCSWSSRNPSDKTVLHYWTPSHPPSTTFGTIKLYWSKADRMINGETAKWLLLDMIYRHQALLTACRLDNCANVKAVYHQFPWPIYRSIYRAPLWMRNTAQWVREGRAGCKAARRNACKELWIHLCFPSINSRGWHSCRSISHGASMSWVNALFVTPACFNHAPSSSSRWEKSFSH